MLQSLRKRTRAGFTLVEIMLVVAILAMLAALAIPNYLRARKRTQAVRMLDDLKAIDHAMELLAAENRRPASDPVTEADVDLIRRYLKERILLYQSLPNDMFGNLITLTDFQTPPRVATTTFNSLSDVAPLEFWAPYSPPE